MNVKLLYLYRDAGNYKNYGQVIFENTTAITLEKIDATLQKRMIDQHWFVADQWGLPDLHFKEFDWDSDLDHEWHEYMGVALSDEPTCEAIKGRKQVIIKAGIKHGSVQGGKALWRARGGEYKLPSRLHLQVPEGLPPSKRKKGLARRPLPALT